MPILMKLPMQLALILELVPNSCVPPLVSVDPFAERQDLVVPEVVLPGDQKS